MGQYQTGTVTVVSGQSTVTGQGTSFLTNVSAGDVFKKRGEDVTYQVASVSSNSLIYLSSNYSGSGAYGVEYQIHRNWSPYLALAELASGDRDWAYHMTQGMIRKIDKYLGGESQLPYTITVSGQLKTNTNLAIGAVSFSAGANQVLAIKTGVAPVSSTSDQISVFSVNTASGQSTLGLSLGQAVQVVETFNPNYKVRMKINGVEYFVALQAV